MLPSSSRPSSDYEGLLHGASTTDLSRLHSGASSQFRRSRRVSRPSFFQHDIPQSPGDSASVTEQFTLYPDPASWNTALTEDCPEDDDFLHNPDPGDRNGDSDRNVFTVRGLTNLGFISFLLLGIVALFGGYPIISHFKEQKLLKDGGVNIGGPSIITDPPSMSTSYQIIDPDTPEEAHTKADYINGQDWKLVFSDEFNVDGRTFWPDDDPYWEAVNLHYWETNNLEWLDPTAVTTHNGSLEITMSKKENHGLAYTSGMITTWNKFCFTGGIVEVSVSLPGTNNVVGFWPAIWMMGNLGRAGYGASLEGMWPYSYDSCDVGTAPNQTKNGQPVAATKNGDPDYGGALSYLPGQRLSRCSCPGSSHPGPKHDDGTYVGRAAPEIDIFEAQITATGGQVSQSAQWAPFDSGYDWPSVTNKYSINDSSITALNSYQGGVFQEATSGLTNTDQSAYQGNGGQYSTYGVQYQPGFDDAVSVGLANVGRTTEDLNHHKRQYIAWISSGEVAWVLQSGLPADETVNISSRSIAQEPMYLIMNLGMSLQFNGDIDFDALIFPATMRVDYIRVYQEPSSINLGCDPSDFPTAAYIDQYLEAYTNPNLTTWTGDYGQPFPKNSFLETC
ncbi:glycoside hydrolase family 16 protein [Laetiporus sulphureus 93-53]|uniref:Glycoside hydrolase family 16 protein n=1 Tax=Laetiporus sulphureus 93-53 TaxID=1314785 RepID=A0A165E0B2_9APHY|nr:glycoside hydrolase family 16 protein [Laetiporus sulphureus 93-53]KZT06001.1 glycoside hydrolase family 16 protein [Laetiporus sulphureus 93-53]